MLNMLYDIILLESSMLFHVTHDSVTMTMTLSCDWCVTMWQWCHVYSNPKFPKIKIKEKEIINEKRKNKIVRVHHLELLQYREPVKGQKIEKIKSIKINRKKEKEVKRILNKNIMWRYIKYLVGWKDFTTEYNV